MTFGDYSPPPSPSPGQQRDALRKGLGRARQWASAGRLGDEPLLEACLRDQRFDGQVEGSRGGWLWQAVRAVGAADRFRVPILHALYDLSDKPSAGQLCDLARHYAAAGDDTFRSRLYEIVEQKPFPDIPWLGEEEAVALDGERGFLFAAGVRGRLLAGREWDWDDGSLIRLAAERLGEESVRRLLDASSDGAISRFRERWRRDVAQAGAGRPGHRREEAASAREVVREAEGSGRCYWFRGWGVRADEGDLQAVLRSIWAAREPGVIANLLKVFSARALPAFDARLIDLCRHGDGEVRRRALAALGQNADPSVREFAVAELRGGGRDGSAVALFRLNYRPGDEHRILEAVDTPEDEGELHGLLMDAVKVLEQNPDADCSRLGVVGYALTPCENCRYYAAKLLTDRHAAPGWLTDECRYDSAEDCRSLGGSPAEPPK